MFVFVVVVVVVVVVVLDSFPVCSFDQVSLVSWCEGYNVILF